MYLLFMHIIRYLCIQIRPSDAGSLQLDKKFTACPCLGISLKIWTRVTVGRAGGKGNSRAWLFIHMTSPFINIS